jgi:drug/metabolite transporter (DMT)-like permease
MTSHTHPLKAAAWMMGAVIGFSTLAIAGRQLAKGLDTFEIMTFRSVIGVVVVLAFAVATGRPRQIKAKALHLHFARNLSHFAGQNLWLYALTLIPLAQLFALEFSYPILVAIGAVLFLGERISRWRAMSFGVGFIGILIVARPFGDTGLSIGLISAIACAFGFAGSALFTKKLTQTANVTLISILFWLSLMQMFMGLICAGIDGDMMLPTAQQWPWIAVLSVAGLGAHMCLTQALSLAPASIVTPIDFLRLPLIAVVGMVFYGESLDAYVFIGAAIIFGANYMNILTESRNKRLSKP